MDSSGRWVVEMAHGGPVQGRGNSRSLALIEWLRGLHAGGFALEVVGGEPQTPTQLVMLLADDLEQVAVSPPVRRVAPAVVAVKGSARFMVACSSREDAERLAAAAMEEEQ